MIIDLILDRKDGFGYDAKEAYDYINKEEQMFQLDSGIAKAMDCGTNKDVQEALCRYIDGQGYNHNLCKYIRSVRWVEE